MDASLVATIVHLDALEGDASRFARLTYPGFASLLHDIREPLVATACWVGGEPAGLALSRIESGTAELLSLFVVRSMRGLRLGSRLLRAHDDRLSGFATVAVAAYAGTLPQRMHFERTLGGCGWATPEVREVRIACRLGHAADWAAGWPGLDVGRDARSHIAFTPWMDRDAESEAVSALAREPSFHPGLAPARYRDRIDATISLGIRRAGHLVGWVLAERVEFGGRLRVNWPSAYVTRSLWGSGAMVRGFVRSLSAAHARYGDDTEATLYAALPRMIALVRRRSPALATAVDIMRTRRVLRSSGRPGGA